MSLRIIETEDGSHSLYDESLRETYHSTHGALRESQHVFISMGLDYYADQVKPQEIKIFEMGLGTGLNAVLTFEWANNKKVKTLYDSIESFPVPQDIILELNYFENQASLKKSLTDLHSLNWDQQHKLSPFFSFQKIHSKIQDFVSQKDYYDIIYFDAFAPNKQEEVWTKEILDKMIKSLRGGGVFVTYCAKGQLKRDLKSLGCHLESLPGPPGKKEMTRATKTHEPHLE